jgi:hypothetical protein
LELFVEMKTYLDCIPCFIRQSIEAARNAVSDTQTHENVVREVLHMAADLDFTHSPPYVGQLIHRRLRERTGILDPYLSAKRRFNQLAVEALPALAAVVFQSKDPLLRAMKLSIAANAIDMGVAASLSESDVRLALQGAVDSPFVGDETAFKKALESAIDILFLADNSGEIAVDRLLIKALGPERVTIAVRGAPVLNDATIDDAYEVKMNELVAVIDNGSDAPGTILSDCSESFLERFNRADLVIAKGQGNFETLSGVEKNIFFLFKVKCPVVARHVELPVGVHVLLHQSQLRFLPVESTSAEER